jgi:undecaprenyl-diphosphatase
MAWYLALGTLPVAAVGLAFKGTIEGALTKNLHVIAASMIGVALLLLLAERLGSRRRGEEDLRWTDALAVGGAQVLALVPGASRSGTTLTGALFVGLTREAGARFSFLLSAPAVAASGILEVVSVREGLAGVGWLGLAVATLVAAVSGFLSIEFLLRFLRRRSTVVFVVYRVALGGLLLGLLISGVIGSGGAAR